MHIYLVAIAIKVMCECCGRALIPSVCVGGGHEAMRKIISNIRFS
jgi:hypothetical protein